MAKGTAKGAAKKAGTARTPGTRSTAGMGEGMPRTKGGGGLPNEIYPPGPASGGTNTSGLPAQVYPGTSASGKKLRRFSTSAGDPEIAAESSGTPW